jgi:hypothetical protein
VCTDGDVGHDHVTTRRDPGAGRRSPEPRPPGSRTLTLSPFSLSDRADLVRDERRRPRYAGDDSPREATRWRRLRTLNWIRIALLVAGLLASDQSRPSGPTGGRAGQPVYDPLHMFLSAMLLGVTSNVALIRISRLGTGRPVGPRLPVGIRRETGCRMAGKARTQR